jgi:UDP-2,4-diacetamido-2,4,6-trideoxy-beta-L-altropyranose hydrolase
MTVRQPTAAAGTIVFRTDAALQIGAGHVMRCLTLADALQAVGWQCHFICRAHPGHLGALIEQRGHALHLVPLTEAPAVAAAASGPAHAHWLGTDAATDAAQAAVILQRLHPDWLVVDHYALDAAWERQLRPMTGRILVIDDLADRPHDADLLLDQNLGSTEAAYRPLVPPQCQLLVGARYALLRPEFAALRSICWQRRALPQPWSTLLVSMGGVDPDNLTGTILDQIGQLSFAASLQVQVVLGPTAPWLHSLADTLEQRPFRATLHAGTPHVARLMADADLAIGAAGTTAWERCCLGLPALMYVLADNQQSNGTALARAGAAVLIDRASQIDLNHRLIQLRDHPEQCQLMSNNAFAITDGGGLAQVISHLAHH